MARVPGKPGFFALGEAASMVRNLLALTEEEDIALLERLKRTNYRGRTVSLLGGIGVALGSFAATGHAGAVKGISGTKTGDRVATGAATAVLSGAVAGLIDDLDAGAHDGDTPAKGLRGHLGALAQGRVTTGALKIAIIGSGAAVAGVEFARSRAGMGQKAGLLILDAAVGTVTVASWANVHNLLDLRPGRALKAAAGMSVPLLLTFGVPGRVTRALAWGAVGTTIAALPSDLREETMLGDTGANALGALVGSALAAHPSRKLRLAAAAAGTALVLISERVSFSEVIAKNPVLSRLDELGRDWADEDCDGCCGEDCDGCGGEDCDECCGVEKAATAAHGTEASAPASEA